MSLALAGGLLSSAAWAQAPEIGGVLPAGGPRGQTTQVHIDGRNLAGAHLFLSGTGVEVKSLQVAPTGDLVTADVAVAAGAQPGPHDVRIVTPKGVSGGMRFWVDVVPNRVLAQAASEGSPATLDGAASAINGRIAARGGQDRFALTASAGETWSFDCYADRIRSRFDPVLELKDEAGVSLHLAQSTWESDPRFSYRFARAGRYFLTVRDSEYNGGPNYTYRLLAGKTPLVTGFMPRGGQPGQTVALALQGSGLTAAAVPVSLPANASCAPSGACWTEVQAAPGVAALLPLLVSPTPVMQAAEGFAPQKIFAFPLAIDGVFTHRSRARFAFHGEANTHYLFDLLGRRIGSRIDGALRILDATGKEVAANDDAPGLGKDARLDFACAASGEYMVEASNVEEVTGPDSYYRLEASVVRPDFRVAIETDRIAVPRGGTIELPVTLERIGGFAAPVTVRSDGLPPGMTCSGGVFTGGKNALTITFTAAPDAMYTASDIHLRGEALIDRRKIVHDAPAWERYEHRSIDLALSVEFSYTRPHHIWDMLLASATERAAPLTVVPAQTILTLAPGASVEIPVRILREPNAKGEIKIEARGLPANVGATIAPIPPGQTEGKLILHAADNAPADIANVILQAKHENAVALAPAIRLTIQKP